MKAPRLIKGGYSHTNRMGHDVYKASYYNVSEVTEYIKETKKTIKGLKAQIKELTK